jgi:hypothetical protein
VIQSATLSSRARSPSDALAMRHSGLDVAAGSRGVVLVLRARRFAEPPY